MNDDDDVMMTTMTTVTTRMMLVDITMKVLSNRAAVVMHMHQSTVFKLHLHTANEYNNIVWQCPGRNR